MPLRAVVVACGVAVAALGVSGCTVSPEEAGLEFRDNLRRDGPNPLIRNQALRDMEAKLRAYAMQPGFDAQSDHLIHLAAPELGLDLHKVRARAAELDRGADAEIVRLFGRKPSSGGDCGVSPTAVPFVTSDNENAGPVAWRFVAGECMAGLALGLATVESQDGTKTFTGIFAGGLPVEGVYVDRRLDVLRVGPYGQPGERVRVSWRRGAAGEHGAYYVGDMVDGRSDGVGVVAWQYDDGVYVKFVGHYRAGLLEGFGASQSVMSFLEGGKTRGAIVGNWHAGKEHGIAGWTNNAEKLIVGTYENGKMHGIGAAYHTDLADPANIERYFRYGGYRHDERHGPHVVEKAWTGIRSNERWNAGEYVDEGIGFDFGQFMALAGGAAVVGMADVPDAAKAQIAGAYAADVLGNTGGGATVATATALSGQAAGSTPATPSPAQQAGAPTASRTQYESYTFSCNHGGTHTIKVGYVDPSKVSYKKAFAKTMACNEIDRMQTVQADCQRVFGNATCAE